MSELVTIVVERADFDATIARMIAVGENPGKALAVVARIMEQNVRNTFRDETDPWGQPWPPHAPSTLAARRREGNTRTSLLVDKGDMFDSIRSESGATFAQVSIDGPAEVHQFGTTTAGRNHAVTIPARPMFPIDAPPDAWWDSVSPPLLDALTEAAA
jgi:phage virion morphogenesis protein